MKVGITLPQFEDGADRAIDAARRAEQLGIDGVFCFDHLWPVGQPGRPAISSGPLAGALAAATSTITVGLLVARIGLLPDVVLTASLRGLDRISGGRVIAGLGTGDSLSRAENEAFGIPFEPADVRRRRMAGVATDLVSRGIPVWVGGGLPATIAVARRVGAAVNLWDGDEAIVSGLAASGLEVTWGGPVPADLAGISERLALLAAAGATWAVCGWPESVEAVAEAARSVR